MPGWAISPKPASQLTPVESEPVQQFDGSTVQHFTTKYGKTFAKRVEPWGQVKWFLKLEG